MTAQARGGMSSAAPLRSAPSQGPGVYPNFTGTWECQTCEGFEEYLDALRVSQHIKKSLLASGSHPTHVITHKMDRLEWCVDAPQGRVASVQSVGQRSVTKNAHGEVTEVARWEGQVWVVDVMQGETLQLEQRRWMEGGLMYHTMSTVGQRRTKVTRVFKRKFPGAPPKRGSTLRSPEPAPPAAQPKPAAPVNEFPTTAPAARPAAARPAGPQGSLISSETEVQRALKVAPAPLSRGGVGAAGHAPNTSMGQAHPAPAERVREIPPVAMDGMGPAATAARRRDFTGTWKAFTCTGLEHYLALMGLQDGVTRALVDRMSLPVHEIRMLNDNTMQCTVVSTSEDVPRLTVEQRAGETMVNTNEFDVVTKDHSRWEGNVWVVDVTNVKTGILSQQRRWMEASDTMRFDVLVQTRDGRKAVVTRRFHPIPPLQAEPAPPRRLSGAKPAAAAMSQPPPPAPKADSNRVPTPAAAAAAAKSQKAKTLVVEEVYQNQRYIPVVGWTSAYMLPSDRKQFSTVEGKMSSDTFPEVKPLPAGWEWDGEWFVDTSDALRSQHPVCDKQGWSYAVDFDWFKSTPQPGEGECSSVHYVRRRRWVRRRRTVNPRSTITGSAGSLLKGLTSGLTQKGATAAADMDAFTPPASPGRKGEGTPRAPRPLSTSGLAQVPPGQPKGGGGAGSLVGGVLMLASRVAVVLIAYPLRWLAAERCALHIAGGHRLVLQNVHLLLSLFWLLCGFVMGEVMASLNDKLLLDTFLSQHQ